MARLGILLMLCMTIPVITPALADVNQTIDLTEKDLPYQKNYKLDTTYGYISLAAKLSDITDTFNYFGIDICVSDINRNDELCISLSNFGPTSQELTKSISQSSVILFVYYNGKESNPGFTLTITFNLQEKNASILNIVFAIPFLLLVIAFVRAKYMSS